VKSCRSGGGLANRLCARRGMDQLRICAPPHTVPKVHDILGNRSEPTSPTPSIHSLSTEILKSDEPCSPSLTDVSVDEWEFDKGELLGTGSMASVYRVTRRSDCQDFAAKHVHSSHPEQLQALRDECSLLQKLCHESIVCAIQRFESCMDAWFCMELCKGGTVEERVKQHGAFSEQVAIRLTRQLLEGLDYLHSVRVVHCDIKPMNLLLVHDDATRLKIADFNCATQLNTHSGSSIMLSVCGTQLYAAPELRFGLLWNERVDVWAAGLSIFFMLRSKQPFNSASRQNAHMLQQGCLPHIAWGAISKCMANLVQQCLVVEMRDRPSPMELLEHRIFSGSNTASMEARAENACRAGIANDWFCQCPVAFWLASCGILMQRPSTACPAARQSPCQPTVQDLALRRYLRIEGGMHSSVKAWTSPI